MDTEKRFADVFARVEKKFILSAGQAREVIAALLGEGFTENVFGSPTIQSVYYDTPDFALVRRSVERPDYKEKLRLRTYGRPNAGSPAYIEIKKKVGGIVYKRRTGLPLDEAEEALRSGILPEECGQIGREVEWFLRRYPGMRPAALIACERRAFENPAKGLRVTFDANIRCRDRDFDMTRRTAGTGLTEPSEILMEVKVPGAYPLWMAGLLWECGARQVHFSKYGTAWTDVILPRRTETKRVLSLGESERTEVRSIA